MASVGIILLSVLFYRYLAPFGKEVRFNFNKTIPGSEALSDLKQSAQLIKTKNSRLTLDVNKKTIEEVSVSTKFKNGQKEILLGVRGDEKVDFSYKPLFFSPLHNIPWSKLEEKGILLYQKNNNYKNISDFIKNPPIDKKIGLYGLNSDIFFSTPTIKQENLFKMPFSIRGNHELNILVNSKPLKIKIAKQDNNKYEGEDRLRIKLYKGKNLIEEKTIEDDSNTDKNGNIGNSQEIEFNIDNPQFGIYRLEINDISDGLDQIINGLEINQEKVVFVKNLFLIKKGKTNLVTDIEKITIETAHKESIQTIKLNNNFKLNIDKENKKFVFDLKKISKSKDKNYSVVVGRGVG